MIKNSILQVAYNIINGHVLNNKYNQLLTFLFESELYSTLQVIYMINIVFLLQQIDVLTNWHVSGWIWEMKKWKNSSMF